MYVADGGLAGRLVRWLDGWMAGRQDGWLRVRWCRYEPVYLAVEQGIDDLTLADEGLVVLEACARNQHVLHFDADPKERKKRRR